MTDQNEEPVAVTVPAIMSDTGQLDPSVLPGAGTTPAPTSPLTYDADGLPFVPYSEIANRYEGELADKGTQAWFEIQTADAVQFISDNVPNLLPRLQSGKLRLRTFYRIVYEVVLRVARNPDGIITESEGGYSVGLRQGVASGMLSLSDRDLETLTGIAERPGRAIGTMQIGLDGGWR